jgi:transcriptional pleiotropic regulator of transition state genes
MKSTGIVRKVDELGRIVVPIELRRTLDIDLKDPVEIFVDGEQIILKKYSPNMACMLTGEVTNENKTFADGKLILSPKGAEILIKEIKSNFVVRT